MGSLLTLNTEIWQLTAPRISQLRSAHSERVKNVFILLVHPSIYN